METAQIQGQLWGNGARDYAALVEPLFRPAFERIFDEIQATPGTKLLDVGCGPGLAAKIAAQRGMQVAGLDAAIASVAIARERTPSGDFRVGAMERLPWADDTFDVVTGFNAFQFASDTVHALREARRVVNVGGRVAMLVWDLPAACDTLSTIAAVLQLLPPRPAQAEPPPPLASPGRIEHLMTQAGLTPQVAGTLACPFWFADLDTAVCAIMSSGGAIGVAQQVGSEPVRHAIAQSLDAFRSPAGDYRQHNTLRYVVAARL